MRLDSILLPHPILRKDRGEIAGRFETHIGLTVDRDDVHLVVSQILHNEVIQDLISSGKAAFFIDISCASTLFRKGFIFHDDGPSSIQIKSKDLRDTVAVTCLILATQDIPKYKNIYTSEFFNGHTFSVSKGEILAYSGGDSFEIDKDWETPGSKGAFFMLWKHSGKDVKYELGSDPILIKLPEEDYEMMRSIKKNKYLKRTFLSLYVYPAMLHVMGEFFSERGETYNLRKWYKRLVDIMKEERMRQIGVSAENAPELVQKIFDYPLTHSVEDLKNISDKFSDD